MKRCFLIIGLIVLLSIGVSSVYADQQLKIGVIHILESHPDHIVLRESFLDALKEKGYELEVSVFDADTVNYPDTYPQRAAEEAKRMEAAGIQLIFCTATYHGVVQADVKIPVIDSVMLSPLLLNLATQKDGQLYSTGNATGTLFGYSFQDITAFVRDAMPDASKIAYLYNPESPISRPIAEIEEAANTVGLEIIGCPFTTKDEVLVAIEKAVKNTDVAFVTNDLSAFGMEKPMLEVADQHKYPVVIGMLPYLEEKAIIAGIQYDWEEAGKICAEKADQILKGTPANTIPLEFPDQSEIGINLKVAEQFGIAIPYEWLELATNVIE